VLIFDEATSALDNKTEGAVMEAIDGLGKETTVFIIAHRFANHYEVVQNVERYIYFYNYKRIHSAIGYITPAQKMAELEKVA